MPEIRANVSKESAQKWADLADLMGTSKTTDTLTTLIAHMHFLYCSSRWPDMQRRAAQLISNKLRFVEPLDHNRICRIELSSNGVRVFLRDDAQPYTLSLKLWNGD